MARYLATGAERGSVPVCCGRLGNPGSGVGASSHHSITRQSFDASYACNRVEVRFPQLPGWYSDMGQENCEPIKLIGSVSEKSNSG